MNNYESTLLSFSKYEVYLLNIEGLLVNILGVKPHGLGTYVVVPIPAVSSWNLFPHPHGKVPRLWIPK